MSCCKTLSCSGESEDVEIGHPAGVAELFCDFTDSYSSANLLDHWGSISYPFSTFLDIHEHLSSNVSTGRAETEKVKESGAANYLIGNIKGGKEEKHIKVEYKRNERATEEWLVHMCRR